MKNNPDQFLVPRHAQICRILSNAVYTDVYIRFQPGMRFRKIKRNNVSEVIVVEIRLIDIQQVLIRAKDIANFLGLSAIANK